MGFFKEFKEDLAQAVNELLPDEQKADDTNEDQEQLVNTLDTGDTDTDEDSDGIMELLNTEDDSDSSILELLDEITKDDSITSDYVEEVSADSESADIDDIYINNMEGEDEAMDENVDLELLEAMQSNDEQQVNETEISDKKEKTVTNNVRTASVANEEDVTVISKGTKISGSISSDGSLDIMGTVNGDIECLGKLSITGQVKGNSSAAEVYVNTERLEGSIISDGSVKVALGTVVIGDITANSGVFAGAVKGEIDINGPVVIDSTAIIKGNIKAKSVQVNNGAVIEGFCSLSYSDVNVDNIFE